jgi:hypothetical protein
MDHRHHRAMMDRSLSPRLIDIRQKIRNFAKVERVRGIHKQYESSVTSAGRGTKSHHIRDQRILIWHFAIDRMI